MNNFDLYFCLLGTFVGILFGFSVSCLIMMIRRQNFRNRDLIYSAVIETIEPEKYDNLEPNLKW